MLSFLYNSIKVLLIILLPFCLLIRGAVYLHYDKGYSSYISLSIAAGFTAVLLVVYFSYLYGSLTKESIKIKYLRRRFTIIFFLVSSFILYSVSYISSSNTKTSSINKEYKSLNPILRLGSSTLFLLDKKAIITDASRIPEDYHKMGLKSTTHSLHYKQEDGYVYAIDLRTKGRSEVRNVFLKVYFYIMGFKSVRHIGTADHLHVSMPCRYRKYAK